MSSVTISPEESFIHLEKRRRAILIVVVCTLIGATAQVFIKQGANHLGHTGFLKTFLGIFTVPQLFVGYCLYAVFTVLFVYALRHGELSILYPTISLAYVWVAILSVVMFHETMNPLKVAGIGVIVAGVAVLGWGSKN